MEQSGCLELGLVLAQDGEDAFLFHSTSLPDFAGCGNVRVLMKSLEALRATIGGVGNTYCAASGF